MQALDAISITEISRHLDWLRPYTALIGLESYKVAWSYGGEQVSAIVTWYSRPDCTCTAVKDRHSCNETARLHGIDVHV